MALATARVTHATGIPDIISSGSSSLGVAESRLAAARGRPTSFSSRHEQLLVPDCCLQDVEEARAGGLGARRVKRSAKRSLSAT